MDAKQQRVVMKTRNLTFAEVMDVRETCTYTASKDPLTGQDVTLFQQDAEISASEQGCLSMLRSRLEDFSLGRFQSNAAKGKSAMESVLRRMEAGIENSPIGHFFKETNLLEVVSATESSTEQSIQRNS